MIDANDCINVLLRGAQRYHLASLQDKNPVVASRHNAYAVSLADALRDIANRNEVMRTHGVDIAELRRDILKVQDRLEGEAFKVLKQLKARGIEIPGV